jgi:hypothetical protein
MGWKKAKDHAASRPEFMSLKDDGDHVEFVALTEPDCATKPGVTKGTTRDVYRLYAQVDGVEKPQILDLGLRAFEAYAESVDEGHELKSVIFMTRHGKKDDQGTTYSFKVLGKAKAARVKLCKSMLATLDTGTVNV